MAGLLRFCFGVHDHQPIGNFDAVIETATVRAYRPFLERVCARSDVRLTLHCTGSLLQWLREHARDVFDSIGEAAARGQLELLTGGFYEPILAILPDADKIGQVERLTEFLRAAFGVRPRGLWLAERVWEPHLPTTLRAAGVEYVVLDDTHFALAGLDPDTLGGYYWTDEQGARVAVFPISQRLRYLIPFGDEDKALEHLGTRRRDGRAITVMDDGEKFGAWPGTYDHVYTDGWLDRFFDRVLGTPWLRMSTLSEVLDAEPASGHVYLPTASYREMMEWALSADAQRALDDAKRELGPRFGDERTAALLRGGFWRGFLVKYPEIGDLYWKMLRTSAAIHGALTRTPADGALLAAREALWRGQANDAYWHGVFGGCYLPHLRRAVKSAVLEAERRAAEAGALEPGVRLDDVNADGDTEVVVRTETLAVTVAGGLGGAITELGFLPRALDVADVLARRPEAYHEHVRRGNGGPSVSGPAAHKEAGLDGLLAYDDFRRASLLDGLFDDGEPLDVVAPWTAARRACAATRAMPRLAAAGDGAVVGVTLGPGLDKTIAVRGATVRADYTLQASGRWAVQWNLALTAGEAPGRYLALARRPSLGSRGRVTDVTSVTLIDEWIGVEVRLAWSAGAELAWAPVETVSVSEGGFERIYQGTALLLTWRLDGDREHRLWTELTIASR